MISHDVVGARCCVAAQCNVRPFDFLGSVQCCLAREGGCDGFNIAKTWLINIDEMTMRPEWNDCSHECRVLLLCCCDVLLCVNLTFFAMLGGGSEC